MKDKRRVWIGLAIVTLLAAPAVAADRVVVAEDFTSVN